MGSVWAAASPSEVCLSPKAGKKARLAVKCSERIPGEAPSRVAFVSQPLILEFLQPRERGERARQRISGREKHLCQLPCQGSRPHGVTARVCVSAFWGPCLRERGLPARSPPVPWRASACVPSVLGEGCNGSQGDTGWLLLLHQQFLQPDHDFKKEAVPMAG